MSFTDSTVTSIIETARQIEPTVRFVPIRGLRRVIRKSRPWDEFATDVPHEFAWHISRSALSRILPFAELGIDPDDSAPAFLLLPQPTETGPIKNLLDLWRALFHARVDRETVVDIESLAGSIPTFPKPRSATIWHEIRTVLESRELISVEDPNAVVTREFLALILELHFFMPEQVEDFFPGLEHSEELIAEILAKLPAAEWFEATRPPGLSLASELSVSQKKANTSAAEIILQVFPDKLESHPKGNDVRAAIDLAVREPNSPNPFIVSLADRIAKILNADSSKRDEWRICLISILAGMKEDGWSKERRILYDLQRACLAMEQELHTADLIEWFVTLGAQPIKRRLDKPRWLLVGRHLRAAAHRASSLAIVEPFAQLEGLLHDALIFAENEARTALRPIIAEVLTEVGLNPRDYVEDVSSRQIVEELLDSAWQRGYLKIGDLRDSLARSRIKLPDLSGPIEFVVGDPLIRANRLLAVRLDGVYHRGEVYMRMLQRACSLFFGTPLGRFLSLYIALPFGGAFVFLEAIHHMAEAAIGLFNWLSGWNKTVVGFQMVAGAASGYVVEHPKSGSEWFFWVALALVGVFFFQMIHWKQFRTTFCHYAVFFLFIAPQAIMHSPILLLLINNPITRCYRRYFLLPTITGAPTFVLSWLVGFTGWQPMTMGLVMAVITMIAIRTTLGRGIEDRFNEVAEQAWRVLSVNFILGAFSLVMSFFNWILEGIDRSIYAVDESLRFRKGQGALVFIAKLLLGVIWFVFTYVFRFAWNLLVEPQINPIKHFPVVTVSHKMFLPLIPSLSKQFMVDEKTMGLIVSGIPGVFGFLVWELKENWKLYQANAAKILKPVIVGSHGETIRALLRPGVHSGVIPKTLAKQRRSYVEHDQNRVARYHHHLEHIAQALHRFVERNFVAYLIPSKRWGGTPIEALKPRLAVNQIRFPILVNGVETPVMIGVEERGGWLIASVSNLEKLATLDSSRREAWNDALAGFYKLMGVHVIREQFSAILGDSASRLDATTEGLLIPVAEGTTEFFRYDDGPEWLRRDRRLEQSLLVYSDYALNWSDWQASWENDAKGSASSHSPMPGWCLTNWPN